MGCTPRLPQPSRARREQVLVLVLLLLLLSRRESKQPAGHALLAGRGQVELVRNVLGRPLTLLSAGPERLRAVPPSPQLCRHWTRCRSFCCRSPSFKHFPAFNTKKKSVRL